MTPDLGRQPKLAAAAAFALGALMPLGFAPYGLWPLPALLLAGLLWLWQEAGPGRAFRLGYLFGLGQFGFGVYWVYISLARFGDASPLFAGLATALLVLVFAVFPGLVGWALARLAPLTGPCAVVGRWLAFPALWLIQEWIREHLWVGFPWLALGYGQSDGPLAGYAPVGGVMAVSLAVLLLAAALAGLAVGGRQRPAGLALLVLVPLLGLALNRVDWTRPSGEPVDVALVQGNISQAVKGDDQQLFPTLERYLELSCQALPAENGCVPAWMPATVCRAGACLFGAVQQTIARVTPPTRPLQGRPPPRPSIPLAGLSGSRRGPPAPRARIAYPDSGKGRPARYGAGGSPAGR